MLLQSYLAILVHDQVGLYNNAMCLLSYLISCQCQMFIAIILSSIGGEWVKRATRTRVSIFKSLETIFSSRINAVEVVKQ